MDSITTHLNMLIQLALADNNMAESESNMIYMIGKANKIKEEEIRQMMDDHMHKNPVKIEFQVLTEEQRFEYLYNVVQLMKIDSEVYLSEIRYCEKMAEKLGYNKGVVKEISSKIYADPAITSDRGVLMEMAQKYRK